MTAEDNEESIPPFLVVPQSLGLAGLRRHRSKLNDCPAENPEGFQFPTPVHLNGCPKDSLVVAEGREWTLYHHVRQHGEQRLRDGAAGSNVCNGLGETWYSLDLCTHQIDVGLHRQCKFGCLSGVLQQRFCKWMQCTGNEFCAHQVRYKDQFPAALAQCSRRSHQTVPDHRFNWRGV